MGFLAKVVRIPSALALVYAFCFLFVSPSYSYDVLDAHRSMLVADENTNPKSDPTSTGGRGGALDDAEYDYLTHLYGGFLKRSMMTAAGPHLYHPTKRVKVPKLGKRSWQSAAEAPPSSSKSDEDEDGDDGLYANYIYRHPLLFKMYTRKFN
uniref:Uncharacterized protein n=1 Tax=Romanomermis culicivorax TaxID=13658 RepID=A0A915K6Y7_ROMCU